MKPNFLFIFLILTLYSCQECDFSISQEQRDFFSYYSVGDTIYFESEKDIDTITIVRVDSIETCGSFMAMNDKRISVQIKHLPVDRWTSGTFIDRYGVTQAYSQKVISVAKGMYNKDDTYWVGVEFRNFFGELHDSCLVQDNYLESLGVSQYWRMENEAANWNQYKNDTSIITSLIYTKEFGVTEYTKRNGEVLRIKNP